MGCEDALDQAENIGAVENVKLRGIFLKDLCEGKLFDCASSVIGRVEGDVGGRSGGRVRGWRLDGYKAVVGRDESGEWA